MHTSTGAVTPSLIIWFMWCEELCDVFHTLILDLKILVQISSLFLILFNSLCITLRFTIVLQLHMLLLPSLIFLHLKSSKVLFLHYKSSKKVSKTIAHFRAFYSKFLHKNHTKRVFWSFPAVEPILVPTFVSESFQLVCTNHWSNSV